MSVNKSNRKRFIYGSRTHHMACNCDETFAIACKIQEHCPDSIW